MQRHLPYLGTRRDRPTQHAQEPAAQKGSARPFATASTPQNLIVCPRNPRIRATLNLALLQSLHSAFRHDQGMRRPEPKSANESRGNRIRQGALVVACHFLDRIRLNLARLSFALLYRNLMGACQIWCEGRSGRDSAVRDSGFGAPRTRWA